MSWTLQHFVSRWRRGAARTVEHPSSEERFRALFEHVPVSIWEEDFSAVQKYIEELRSLGVVDFSTYFDTHPEAIAKSAALVKIVDVNCATLEMYQADNKEQLLSDLSKILGPESLASFKEELLALIRGDLIFENENSNFTLRGESRIVSLHISVAPGCEKTWARVFVGISDITARRQAESRLQASETMFRALFDLSPDAVLVIDPHDRDGSWPIQDCNIAAGLMNGYGREELIGQSVDILNVTPGTQAERIAYLGQLRDQGNMKLEAQHRRKNGVVFPVEISTTLIMVGERELIIGIDRDITLRKQIEEALRQNEERFKLMAWATKDAVWDWDLQTNQIWWGEGLQKIFHYSSELTQTNVEWWFEHIHPEDIGKVQRTLNQALQYGMEFWSKEYRFRRADQTYANIMDRGYIIQNSEGKPYRVIGAMIDITERKQAEDTIHHHNEMLSSLHYITLNLLRHRDLSQLLNALVEFSTTLLDAPYAEIMLVEDEKLVVKAVTQNQQHLIGKRVGREEAVLSWQAFDRHELAVLADYAIWPWRQKVYEEFSLHAVADFPILNDDQCLGVLAVGRDKAEYEFTTDQIQFGRFFADLTALVLNNAQLRDALREQSIRDPLTGLFNRRYMEETLKREVGRVARQQRPLGIIMIDIDYFKCFNDTYGHRVGDALLHKLGLLLQRRIRGEDIACRYGGEEFILIMPDASLEIAQQRAEDLRQEARQLRVQDECQSPEVITLSLGVAVYPQHGSTIENVLRAADVALYHAKQEGRDRVVVAENES